jgi:hypothetical protein
MSVFSKLKAGITGLTEEQQETVNEVKALIKKEHDHEVSLSDPAVWDDIKDHLPKEGATEEEIGACLSAAMDEVLADDPTWDEEATNDNEDEGVTDADRLADRAATAPRSAQKADQKAIELADTLRGNERVIKELSEFVEIENKRKRAPASLGFLFLKTLGENQLLSCPTPGSRYDDVDEDGKMLYGPKGKFPHMAYDVRKPGKDGGGSFCQDVANQLPLGREHITALADVRAAMGKDKDTQTSGKYRGWNTTQLEEEEGWHKSQLNLLKNAVKVGLSTAIKITQVSKKTKLSAKFRTTGKDDKETVLPRHAVVEVYYLKEVMHEGKKVHQKVDIWVNASTLLRVDLDEVGKLDDPQDQLDAFVARRGTGDSDEEDSKFIAITNADETSDVLYEINARKSEKAYQASLQRKIAGPDGGEFLDQMAGVYELFGRYLKRKENQEKMAQYRATQEEANEKKEKAA